MEDRYELNFLVCYTYEYSWLSNKKKSFLSCLVRKLPLLENGQIMIIFADDSLWLDLERSILKIKFHNRILVCRELSFLKLRKMIENTRAFVRLKFLIFWKSPSTKKAIFTHKSIFNLPKMSPIRRKPYPVINLHLLNIDNKFQVSVLYRLPNNSCSLYFNYLSDKRISNRLNRFNY